ncbi:MAG: hypothetical protein H6945_01795 [Zoogloeaceae bacterium]|nr:hypothetical protein [Zoogloeaceae bacterium]
MEPMFGVAIALGLLWSMYYAIRIGSLDPHNLQAHLSNWFEKAQAVSCLVAFMVFIGAKGQDMDLASFCAMYILGQTVAPAFTGGEEYRKDEVDSFIFRWLLKKRAKISGVVLMTALSAGIAYTIGLFIGDWWFLIFLLVGLVLVSSKALQASMMASGDEGEISRLPSESAQQVAKLVARTLVYGVIGYLISGVALGWMLFQEAGLQPTNWSGWMGLLLGALVQWDP